VLSALLFGFEPAVEVFDDCVEAALSEALLVPIGTIPVLVVIAVAAAAVDVTDTSPRSSCS